MRIAQVAPLFECTPPKAYGGVERIVAYLTDELVAQGHHVTLFATADSTARASELIACADRGVRTDPDHPDAVACHLAMLGRVAAMRDEFDLIHFHLDQLHLPLARAQHWPHVTTIHGRLDRKDQCRLYEEFRDLPVVSISDSQRRPVPDLNWQGTVYNALPLHQRTFSPRHEGYLAFMGRISPEKGPGDAIRIARESGMPLKIAAKIDDEQRPYFEKVVEPHLGEDIEFVGEIGGKAKDDFFGNAAALLFPIDWPEPFGLVMIEAMACGTPVIAFLHGAVPEVVADGVSGFVVPDVAAAVSAVACLEELDRRACRRHFEENFSAARMVQGYVGVYEQLLGAAATEAATA